MKKYGLTIVVLLLAAGTSTATFLGFHQFGLMQRSMENADPFSVGAHGGEGRISVIVPATRGLTGQGGTGGVPSSLDTMQSSLLFIEGIGGAGSNGTVTATGGTGGDSYTDILFWWRAESATLATGDYPTSGTLTANNASATIAAGAAKVGSYGVSSVAAYAYYYKASASGALLDPSAGRVGFWFKYNSAWQTKSLFKYYVDASNRFYVTGSTGGNLSFVYQSGGSNSTATSTVNNLVADTWYFVELIYDTTTDVQKIYLNGSQIATTTLSLTAISSTGQIQIGESSGSSSPNEFIDNIMVSNSITRDFYGGGTGLCVATSSPR